MNFRLSYHVLMLGIALFALISGARADTIDLKNGARLVGTVKALKGGTLVLETDYAGLINVPAGEIIGITTNGVVTVRFGAGGYATGQLRSQYAGTVQIAGVGQPTLSNVAIAAISEIHPGREVPRGLQWSGIINVGVAIASGNTDSESFHVDGAVTGRAEKDRIKARADFNRETESGTRTEDNYTGAVQHDRFVSDKLFFFTSVKLENDDVALLNLRTTLSTGVGYQFAESDRTNVSVEAGPAFVIEDIEGSPNNESIAGRWAVTMDHYVWKRIAQVFHRHDGLVNLEDTGDILIESSTGIRMFVAGGLNVTAQLDLDWDKKPEPGVTSLDKRYMLTLGYQF